MVAIYGINREQMLQLVGQLRQESQEVEALRSRLAQTIGNAYFEGPWANRFKGAWNDQYSQSLRNLSQLLDELGAEVQRRTDAGTSALG